MLPKELVSPQLSMKRTASHLFRTDTEKDERDNSSLGEREGESQPKGIERQASPT
jgi:hypothetical protein